jgi:hypothetical protein
MMPLRCELNECVDNMQAVTGLSLQETISEIPGDEFPFQTGFVIFKMVRAPAGRRADTWAWRFDGIILAPRDATSKKSGH